jgi:hypothetical protein
VAAEQDGKVKKKAKRVRTENKEKKKENISFFPLFL